MKKHITGRRVTGIALGLLLVVTRFGHFGHDLQPADASWAVFVLGGAWLGGARAFIALCALAGAVDVSAFGLGESSACMSPAYLFLLPAYAALFAAGRWSVASERLPLLRAGGAAVVGSVAAFVITNASYYAFTPSLSDMTAGTYTVRVAPYVFSYVTTTLVYTLAAHALLQAVRALRGAALARRDVG